MKSKLNYIRRLGVSFCVAAIGCLMILCIVLSSCTTNYELEVNPEDEGRVVYLYGAEFDEDGNADVKVDVEIDEEIYSINAIVSNDPKLSTSTTVEGEDGSICEFTLEGSETGQVTIEKSETLIDSEGRTQVTSEMGIPTED